MKNKTILVAALLLLTAAGYALLFSDLPLTRNDGRAETTAKTPKNDLISQVKEYNGTVQLGDYKIALSKKVGNLEVFIIDGKEELGHKEYIPLSQAIENEWVKVRETSNVSELAIDNNSEHFIYINSGDIVKGGKQDRTMQEDLIVGPGSKNESLASFCVESGRWQKRGGENVGTFAVSDRCLPSKELRLAARKDKNQSRVWANVANEQRKLNYNLSKKKGYDVNIEYEHSPTSLQKALEDSTLLIEISELKKEFRALLQESDNEVGFAYAINGELYAIEMFNNQDLLNKLWDKLITAVVTESIAEEGNKADGTVMALDILKAIEQREADVQSKKLNKETKVFQYDWKDNSKVGFKTVDRKEGDQWLHYSILTTSNETQPSTKNTGR